MGSAAGAGAQHPLPRPGGQSGQVDPRAGHGADGRHPGHRRAGPHRPGSGPPRAGAWACACCPTIPTCRPHGLAGLPAERRDLPRLLAASDAVSLHVPVTDETRNLIDARGAGAHETHRRADQHGTCRVGGRSRRCTRRWPRKRLAGAASDVVGEEPPIRQAAGGARQLHRRAARRRRHRADVPRDGPAWPPKTRWPCCAGNSREGVVNPDVYAFQSLRRTICEIHCCLGQLGLVPVVKVDRPEDAMPLGKALIAGGLPCAEITFRTAAAAEAIARAVSCLPRAVARRRHGADH